MCATSLGFSGHRLATTLYILIIEIMDLVLNWHSLGTRGGQNFEFLLKKPWK